MTARSVQISAFVSDETRTLLDEAAEARGLKKAHVIEEALLNYLHALRELPADVFVPTRLVLTEASAREVAEMLANPRSPTPEMQRLMAGEDGDDVPG